MAALNTSPIHHGSLYFPDGDLVLFATGSEGRVAFRAHSSVLARHSPVFADMLALGPNSENAKAADIYDGVPSVELQDSAHDFERFLGSMYRPGHPVFKHYDPDFPVVAHGVMSLAKKYQVDNLSDAISNHVVQQWPRSAAELILFQETVRQTIRTTIEFSNEPTYGIYQSKLPEPGSAIRLAMDFDIPSVLPGAFYILATMNRACVWTNDLGIWHGSDLPARWSLLDEQDNQRLHEGQQALAGELVRYRSLLREQSSHSPRCQDEWERLAKKHFDISDPNLPAPMRAIHRADPMHRLSVLFEDCEDGELCIHCSHQLRLRLKNTMLDLWDSLPTFFNLELPQTHDI